MKRLLLLSLGIFLPAIALAHVPVLPEFSSEADIVPIEEPNVSQAYYAELIGFSHHYQFTIDEEQEIFVEVLVPDITEAQNNIGGTIVRNENTNEAVLVHSLEADTASWESFYEIFGGDSYRQGPSFREVVPPGEYRIEISAPENKGKYVLVVGELEDFSDVGILETLKRIYKVKQYYNKPPIAILQSPFYSVPLGLILILGLLVYWWKRKHA